MTHNYCVLVKIEDRAKIFIHRHKIAKYLNWPKNGKIMNIKFSHMQNIIPLWYIPAVLGLEPGTFRFIL